MKRFIFGMLAVALLSMMTGAMVSCTSCGKGEPGEPEVIHDTVIVSNDYNGCLPDDTKLVFENVVSTHRQQMYNLIDGDDYTWYESHAIMLMDLDEPEQDGTITDITSVFAVWPVCRANYVQYITTNWTKGTWIPEPIPGLWIEDYNLNMKPVNITFQEAYDRLIQANCPKPHDKNVTLRCPVGPKACNAQYVFGNIIDVVFVDAVTGEVRRDNPAF